MNNINVEPSRGPPVDLPGFAEVGEIGAEDEMSSFLQHNLDLEPNPCSQHIGKALNAAGRLSAIAATRTMHSNGKRQSVDNLRTIVVAMARLSSELNISLEHAVRTRVRELYMEFPARSKEAEGVDGRPRSPTLLEKHVELDALKLDGTFGQLDLGGAMGPLGVDDDVEFVSHSAERGGHGDGANTASTQQHETESHLASGGDDSTLITPTNGSFDQRRALQLAMQQIIKGSGGVDNGHHGGGDTKNLHREDTATTNTNSVDSEDNVVAGGTRTTTSGVSTAGTGSPFRLESSKENSVDNRGIPHTDAYHARRRTNPFVSEVSSFGDISAESSVAVHAHQKQDGMQAAPTTSAVSNREADLAGKGLPTFAPYVGKGSTSQHPTHSSNRNSAESSQRGSHVATYKAASSSSPPAATARNADATAVAQVEGKSSSSANPPGPQGTFLPEASDSGNTVSGANSMSLARKSSVAVSDLSEETRGDSSLLMHQSSGNFHVPQHQTSTTTVSLSQSSVSAHPSSSRLGGSTSAATVGAGGGGAGSNGNNGSSSISHPTGSSNNDGTSASSLGTDAAHRASVSSGVPSSFASVSANSVSLTNAMASNGNGHHHAGGAATNNNNTNIHANGVPLGAGPIPPPIQATNLAHQFPPPPGHPVHNMTSSVFSAVMSCGNTPKNGVPPPGLGAFVNNQMAGVGSGVGGASSVGSAGDPKLSDAGNSSSTQPYMASGSMVADQPPHQPSNPLPLHQHQHQELPPTELQMQQPAAALARGASSNSMSNASQQQFTVTSSTHGSIMSTMTSVAGRSTGAAVVAAPHSSLATQYVSENSSLCAYGPPLFGLMLLNEVQEEAQHSPASFSPSQAQNYHPHHNRIASRAPNPASLRNKTNHATAAASSPPQMTHGLSSASFDRVVSQSTLLSSKSNPLTPTGSASFEPHNHSATGGGGGGGGSGFVHQ